MVLPKLLGRRLSFHFVERDIEAMAAPLNRIVRCAQLLRPHGLLSAVEPWAVSCTRNVQSARKRVLLSYCKSKLTSGSMLVAASVCVTGGISAAIARHFIQQPDGISFISKVQAKAKEDVKPAAKPTRMV